MAEQPPYHQALKEALGRAMSSGDLSGAASLLRLAARAQAPADARQDIIAVIELTIMEMIGYMESLGQDVIKAFEAQDAAEEAGQKKPETLVVEASSETTTTAEPEQQPPPSQESGSPESKGC